VKGTEAMVEFITKYAPDRKGEVDYLVSVARHHRNVAHRDKRWTDGNMTLRMRTVRARQEYVSLKGIVRRLEGDGSTPKDKLALYQQLLSTARLRHNKYLQLLRIQ
jgi:hypothetical protein